MTSKTAANRADVTKNVEIKQLTGVNKMLIYRPAEDRRLSQKDRRASDNVRRNTILPAVPQNQAVVEDMPIAVVEEALDVNKPAK